MFTFEFDPIYDIFEGESVLEMLNGRLAKEKPAWVRPLLEAFRLHCTGSARVSSQEIPSVAGLTERNLSAALRHWTNEGILRRVSYRPSVYRFLDPVPMDTDHILRYTAFAGCVEAEFRDYREPLPYEIELACAWRTYPGLREEVILEVLRQLLRGDANAGVKSAEPMLPIVKNAVSRQEAAEALAEHVKTLAACREILLRLGQDREPTQEETAMYAGWVNQWGFTHDAVLQACAAAARGNPRFDYLNGILRNIYQQAHPGAPLDAEAVDASFQITAEFREIARLAGSGTVSRHLEEYRRLREQYDHDLIRLSARESEKAGEGFDGIAHRLVRWEELGLASGEEVRAYLDETQTQHDLMAELFAQWGLEGSPTPRDIRLARQWIRAGFSRDLILTAAEYAFAAEDPPLYTAKILRRFQEKGIQTPRQAELDHQAHLREQSNRSKRE